NRAAKKKILVVDNSPVVLSLLGKFLEKQGHDVVMAGDGLSALEILKTYRPDLIFLDLIMPNIDGKKLSRLIRSSPVHKDACLIILSAVAVEDGINIGDIGANACIAKGPFDTMSRQILETLQRLDENGSNSVIDEIIGVENINPRDITKELLDISQHFEVALESLTEGIVELNNGSRIVFANPAASAIIGQPEENLLSACLTQFFDKKDKERIAALMDVATTSCTNVEGSFLLANGKEVSVSVVPIQCEKYRHIVIINDITLQNHLEQELRQAQKMEAIGTLAGGIAHDFNNLLMSIQGFASLMLLNIDTFHPFYAKLRGIEQQVTRGADLTRQLLGFAQRGKYNAKPADLNELIRRSSHLFDRSSKDIAIHVRYQPDIWTVNADHEQFKQVLLNLYANACQAMPRGGNLYIETENITLDEEEALAIHGRSGRFVKFSLKDNGVGMDERTRERIFEPFFTTRETGKGVGLGLASVYGIVKNHDGFIRVQSEQGKGTQISIYLPALGKEDFVPTGPPALTTATGETILLVDDEMANIEVTREILETLGYQVLTALDGQEAVDVYRNRGGKIDLVILDMIMPVLDGGETFDILKSLNPDIRVILYSGYSIDGQAMDILSRGCKGFIQKPFTIGEIAKKIREALD
ncbi:MAG: response regulator, partial [Deltaproteobacteria bacterium]|nr:response regulator [Deltaproteobacteria bacterium]